MVVELSDGEMAEIDETLAKFKAAEVGGRQDYLLIRRDCGCGARLHYRRGGPAPASGIVGYHAFQSDASESCQSRHHSSHSSVDNL